MAGRQSSSSSPWPSGSSGKNDSPGRTAWRCLSFLAKVGALYALIYLLWIPVQAVFVRLLAGASEWALKLIEHPLILTGLSAKGNSITIYSYVAGAPQALTRIHCDPLHITVVLSIALVMAVPFENWRARIKACGITVFVVFLAVTAVCVVQVQMAAENHAVSSLGLTLYSHSEKRFLDWAVRKSSLLTVYVIPAFLFLFFFLSARSGAGKASNAGREKGARVWSHWTRIALVAAGITAGWLFWSSARATPPGVVQIDGLRKIAALNPSSARAHFNLALHLDKADSRGEALASYRRAQLLDPEHIGAYLGAGNIYHRDGDYARASQNYEEVLRRDPGSTAALFNLGNTLMKAGAFDRAVTVFGELVRRDPDNGAAHLGLGNALRLTHRQCDALTHFERAADIDRRLAADGTLVESIRSLRVTCNGR